MQFKDINRLGLSDKTIVEMEVNPLALIASDEFNTQSQLDYRQTALERVLNLRFRFTSEFNTMSELFKKIISLKCPHCGKEVKVTGRGGNSVMTTFSGTCALCDVTIAITIPYDAINYIPREKRHECNR